MAYGARWRDHSRKGCWCGGHNASNAKRNRHHHGTRQRLGYRQARRFLACVSLSDVYPVV